MKRLLRYLPSIEEVTLGTVIIIVGLFMLDGGGYAIRSAPGAEPHWFYFPKVESWVCWLVVWVGVDKALFSDRAMPFVLQRTLMPWLLFMHWKWVKDKLK